MALVLIDNTATELTVSTQWGELVERSGKNMLGFGLNLPLFTLTNWDSGASKPAVAIGSIVEVGGSFYQADAETALTDEGGLADGICHIKLVVAGDGLSVTPTLTNDSIPAWDSEKFGWYDGTTKFLPYEFTQGGAGTTWSDKKEYKDQLKNVLQDQNGRVQNREIYMDYIEATVTTAMPSVGLGQSAIVTFKNINVAAPAVYVQLPSGGTYEWSVVSDSRIVGGASSGGSNITFFDNGETGQITYKKIT